MLYEVITGKPDWSERFRNPPSDLIIASDVSGRNRNGPRLLLPEDALVSELPGFAGLIGLVEFAWLFGFAESVG